MGLLRYEADSEKPTRRLEIPGVEFMGSPLASAVLVGQVEVVVAPRETEPIEVRHQGLRCRGGIQAVDLPR